MAGIKYLEYHLWVTELSLCSFYQRMPMCLPSPLCQKPESQSSPSNDLTPCSCQRGKNNQDACTCVSSSRPACARYAHRAHVCHSTMRMGTLPSPSPINPHKPLDLSQKKKSGYTS